MTYPTVETVKDYDAVALLMHRLLQATVDVFEEADIELPTRQYIHLGAVAQDCEQVTVQLLQVFMGTPNTPPGQPVRCPGARSAFIRVNILRSAPTVGSRGALPTPEELTAAAEIYSRDVWLLLSIPQRVNDMNGVIIADVDPIEVEGGLAGAGLNLTMVIP